MPTAAEEILFPGAARSGFVYPYEPWNPRALEVVSSSNLPLWTRRPPLRSSPRRISRVPACAVSRTLSDALFATLKPGIVSFPAIPSSARSSWEERTTPLAPAFSALSKRTFEPHEIVPSSFAHSIKTHRSLILAASSALNASHPNLFEAGAATTLPRRVSSEAFE